MHTTAFIRTILLADDDEDDRDFFSAALKDVSGQTSLLLAENGLQAMNILDGAQPDLVFLDLNMPLKNGFECLREIKKRQQWQHIPVIIFSTSLQPGTVNDTFAHGASLYMVKPNSFPDLKCLIEKVLAINWQAMPAPSRENYILQA